MKKIVIKILFFFFFLNNCLAQPFGANNATWYYDIYNPWMQAQYPSILSSSPPNVINGIEYYTISYTNTPGVCSTDNGYTVYESNDSVYYFLTASNRFTLLYNFNALPGDTQIIYGNNMSGGEDSVVMKIDSVSLININGFNKKIFYTSYLMFSPYFYFEGPIIEDIGSIFFLFPQYTFCDPFHGPLRCYEDTIIGLYQPFMPGSACDTIIYLDVEELHAQNIISLSPNPTTDFITIHYNSTSQKETTLSLFNLYGQIVYSENPEGLNEIKIDMRSFPAGIYFVKVSDNEKEEVRKVVKY